MSIEDKVFRFADRDRHLLYIEPEGLDSEQFYINGLSTSLPPVRRPWGAASSI